MIALIAFAGPVQTTAVSRYIVGAGADHLALRRNDDGADLPRELTGAHRSAIREKHRMLVEGRRAERVADIRNRVRHERPLALLRESVKMLVDSGARLEHARSLVELGSAIRRSEKRSDAREPLHSGMELAHGCGAAALAERAREELVLSGARPRRMTRTGHRRAHAERAARRAHRGGGEDQPRDRTDAVRDPADRAGPFDAYVPEARPVFTRAASGGARDTLRVPKSPSEPMKPSELMRTTSCPSSTMGNPAGVGGRGISIQWSCSAGPREGLRESSASSASVRWHVLKAWATTAVTRFATCGIESRAMPLRRSA